MSLCLRKMGSMVACQMDVAILKVGRLVRPGHRSRETPALSLDSSRAISFGASLIICVVALLVVEYSRQWA
jgi:hypothetical protein